MGRDELRVRRIVGGLRWACPASRGVRRQHLVRIPADSRLPSDMNAGNIAVTPEVLMRPSDGSERLARLAARFTAYVEDGIPRLKRMGYNPTEFLAMVHRHDGAVGATKQLLADPRHTSYGFQRLHQLGRLEDSVEFAALVPWFEELFTDIERYEARTRLITHEFPLA